jgi:hypothetical protein
LLLLHWGRWSSGGCRREEGWRGEDVVERVEEGVERDEEGMQKDGGLY